MDPQKACQNYLNLMVAGPAEGSMVQRRRDPARAPTGLRPGSGLRPHPSDGQLDHFRRTHEANRRMGSAKAGGDDEMMVSLDDMTVDEIAPPVAAHEILGEYGEVHLAAVRVAAERERNAVRNPPENGGLMRQQDDGAGPLICAMVPPRSSRPVKSRGAFGSAI
jgi:hypothetical protein